MAKNYIDNLGEDVRKGMIEKARQGHWPTVAPVGYVNNAATHRIEPDRAHVQGVWTPAGDSDRQRGPVCVRAGPLRAEQAVRVVAATRDPRRTDHARAPATERPA